MKKEKGFIKNCLIYTFLFAILAILITYIFNANDKTFLWKTDGYAQHFVTLDTFKDFLLTFFKTGKVKAFYWNIANGIDLFSNYAYYSFGDFFSYLAIFIAKGKMMSFYSFLCLFRMYFIGISFLIYCRYKKINDWTSIIGALMYTFCAFSLFSVFRHPYFSNALIILPLLMMEIEKIILEDKFIFYTFIISILYIISFYFAYMLTLIVAIYGSLLIFINYKKDGIKKIIKKYVQVILFSALGILMSAVILLPTGISFLNSERTSISTIYPYSFPYYKNLLVSLITPTSAGYWVLWGVQSLILITLPIFFKQNKDYSAFKWLIAILLIPILFSNVATIFCGFSFPNNRWSFVFCFVFSFITTVVLKDLKKVNMKHLLLIVAYFSLVFLIVFLLKGIAKKIIVFEFLILIGMIILLYFKKILDKKFLCFNIYRCLFTIIFVIGIGLSINFIYNTGGYNYQVQFVASKDKEKIFNTSNYKINEFNKSINYIKEIDDDIYNIGKRPYSFNNLSLIFDYNSMGSFFSITPNVYMEISKDLNNIDHNVSTGFKEFNYRTKITSLLGNKYLVNTSNVFTPYGYTLLKKQNKNNKIFINNNYVDFASLYTKYISIDDYNKLTPLEKETSLLKYNALDRDDKSYLSGIDFSKYIKELNYEDVLENKAIEVKNINNDLIKLKIDKAKDSELYVYIKNLKYKPYSRNERFKKYNGNSLKKKLIKYKNYLTYVEKNEYNVLINYKKVKMSKRIRDYKTDPYYEDIDEMTFNLGYYENIGDEISISFSKTGYYTFDDIKVYAVNMKDYEEDVKKLNEANFELLSYDNNYLEANVTPSKDGVLQFRTFYDKGWKVYVDDKEVKTFKANKYFLGIDISEGKHNIKLVYKTLYLKEGFIISLISLIVFGIVSIIYLKRKN